MRPLHALSIAALASLAMGTGLRVGLAQGSGTHECRALLELHHEQMARLEHRLGALERSSYATTLAGAAPAKTDLATLREQLAGGLRDEIDSAVSATRRREDFPAAVLPGSIENERARTAAARLVEDAVASGHWRGEDTARLDELSHGLTPDQYDELRTVLVRAENDGVLDREGSW